VGLAIALTALVVTILAGLVYAARKKPSFLETLRNSLPSRPTLPRMPGFR